MSFLDQIFAGLEAAPNQIFLTELRDASSITANGKQLADLIANARVFLVSRSLRKGDRCALLAPNSIAWVAMDLAIMAEGLIVVPLYSRQAPQELVAMMKDCSPSLIVCGDPALRDGIVQNWPGAPPQTLLEEIFGKRGAEAQEASSSSHADSDPVAIIYTSGTSGEAKGVILTAGNVAHMLGCTSGRLGTLMQGHSAQER